MVDRIIAVNELRERLGAKPGLVLVDALPELQHRHSRLPLVDAAAEGARGTSL